MAVINWKSEKILNRFPEESILKIRNGTRYEFGGDDHIIFNDSVFNDNALTAYGKMGTTELILMDENSIWDHAMNVYDLKDNSLIGNITHSDFTLHKVLYNVHLKHRSIFNQKQPCNAVLLAYRIYNDILVKINIDKTIKKWYNSIYNSDINGTMECGDNNNKVNEMILCSFFYLHHHLHRSRNRD